MHTKVLIDHPLIRSSHCQRDLNPLPRGIRIWSLPTKPIFVSYSVLNKIINYKFSFFFYRNVSFLILTSVIKYYFPPPTFYLLSITFFCTKKDCTNFFFYFIIINSNISYFIFIFIWFVTSYYLCRSSLHHMLFSNTESNLIEQHVLYESTSNMWVMTS